MCLGFCSLLHLSVFFSLFRVYLAVPLPDPFMVVLMDPWGSVQRLTAASVVFCRRLTSRARRPSSSWCPSPSWGPTRRSRRVWSVNWRRSSLASTLSSLRRLVPLCLGVGQPCHLVPMYYHRQGDGFNCNQFFGDTLSLKGNQTEEALQALVINGISSLHTTPFCSVSRPVCKKSGWKSQNCTAVSAAIYVPQCAVVRLLAWPVHVAKASSTSPPTPFSSLLVKINNMAVPREACTWSQKILV